MFAPPRYKVRKFPLSLLLQCKYHLSDTEELNAYFINQQDNMLFRQIRLITGNSEKQNDYIVFVNCKGGKSHKEEMTHLIQDGLWIGNRHYVSCERSASMVRTSIVSFVDESIAEELTARVTMDIHIKKTVLSKWYAYRGLMLSSCHCLEGWFPRIIIVPDMERIIPNQQIKYVYDNQIPYEKDGEILTWRQKDIATGMRDITINVFDGCGIHHPDITDEVRGMLDAKSDPTSILWRAPFIKGVTHEMDYASFFAERGVHEIVDVWGVKHDVSPDAPPAIIMCESMYKGKKYFDNTGTYADWVHYWHVFKKYNHCIGVAKWNFSLAEEPVYTRANYQILQDLDLPYEEFAMLAQDSMRWITQILSGDPVALYSFLGLYADNCNKLNLKMEAIAKNHHMLYEKDIRKYVLSLINKTIDEMKCGKLYLKACFKFLAPDLIMLMEHIGGLPPEGCLSKDEFFSFNADGLLQGEYLIERNPHICKSEHVILRAVENDLLNRYCSHLVNVCMINGKSITPQRLNGADFDGDLVLVIDNEQMMRGVHRDIPIVIDVEDKVTVLEEADTPENAARVALRGMNSLIGETSNCATAYHNKKPSSDEMKQKYESYIDLLSVINGKAIDSAKTGIVYNIPRYIAKYGRTLPYFMKYASPYYAAMKHLSKTPSNMNRLCKEIEVWHRSLKWQKPFDKMTASKKMKEFEYHINDQTEMNTAANPSTFDYTMMMDSSIPFDENKFQEIESLYLEYCRYESKMIREHRNLMSKTANNKKGQREYAGYINQSAFHNAYRIRCLNICFDVCELANYVVLLCYERYPKRSKSFLWAVAGEGIVSNIKPVEHYLPMRDPKGTYTYLGKHYRMEKIMLD